MLRLATTTNLAFILAAACIGCNDDRAVEEPKTAYDTYDYPVTIFEDSAIDPDEVEPVAGVEPGVEVITVEDKIAQICDIPEPSFSFDSANLREGVEPALDALAACLTKGALREETIILIGHADERGTPSYNLGLGQRRATAVADYFTSRGVDAARVIATTRGELDAQGTDDASWADDRRVQIILRK